MSMTRRDAIIGVGGVAGSMAGGLSQAQALGAPTLATIKDPTLRKKSLIVKEMAQEEIAEFERLETALTSAQLALSAYHVRLRSYYGEEPGVNVNFDSGYVFIRDYRDDMNAKQQVLEQWAGNQAQQSQPTRHY